MQRREYHLKGDVGPPPSTANGGAVAATMTTMTMTLNGEAPTLATIEGIQPKLAVESSSLLVAPASVVNTAHSCLLLFSQSLLTLFSESSQMVKID